MPFEFSVAKKFLIPTKRRLSISLIALMSIGMIALVVWLVLIFLSVTDGIEKSWLQKVVSLNAPIRITPTDRYYHSYYYQIDEISSASNYSSKSIEEKRRAPLTDPYVEGEDPAIPEYWPKKVLDEDGSVKDLVKLAFSSIERAGEESVAQEYEIGAAILKLQMRRLHGAPFTPEREENRMHLTQASYLASFCEKNPQLHTLVEPPRTEDLNHLFFLIASPPKNGREVEEFQHRLDALLSSLAIERMITTSCQWHPLFDLLPEDIPFEAWLSRGEDGEFTLILPMEKKTGSRAGTLTRRGERLICTFQDGRAIEVGRGAHLLLEEPLSMRVECALCDPYATYALSDMRFEVRATLQGIEMRGRVPWEGMAIERATARVKWSEPPRIPPPWPYFLQMQNGEMRLLLPSTTPDVGLLLPKNFQTADIKIGDTGHLSYGAATMSGMQEQRMRVAVLGFYDPGLMGIGAKPILAPNEVVHTINASSHTPSFDRDATHGIQVWFHDLKQTERTAMAIERAFGESGIAPYWKITPYYEYESVKDLILQFQSDRYLFSLVGALILLVACCNIVSLLIILVNDKQEEIAILRAMGASKKSIACIFTLCGTIVGTVGTAMGICAAMLTLHHIDTVMHFLGFLQGHEVFNALFYGRSLPNQLSPHAITFISIATPMISLLSALIPAIKACKGHPSAVLRSKG